jgi:hypothetical protein
MRRGLERNGRNVQNLKLISNIESLETPVQDGGALEHVASNTWACDLQTGSDCYSKP